MPGQRTEGPGTYFATVTPSDVTVLNPLPRMLYVGTLGDLVIKSVFGETVTLKNFSSFAPVRVSQVMAATTASDIVAIW